MTTRIACGHCGGVHASVAEVRHCSVGDPSSDATTPPVPEATLRPVGRTTLERTALERTPLDRTVAQLAGPPALGRSVVIPAGADVPEPWADAPVVDASAEADPDTVDRLLAAWRNRERIVISWSGPRPAGDEVLDEPFHRLTPSTELPGERLRFAVEANAIDLLDGAPRFDPLDRALAAGATLAERGEVAGDGDDRPAWVDGGPLAPLPPAMTDGLAVIPRAQLMAGRLGPATPDPAAPAADLAPDQLAAVAHEGGPARIIAPAGSGKTRVLTERARHLVRDRGMHPSAVSLVAYNRRAREEMELRLADVGGLDIRTLNSLALAIATGTGPFAPTAGSGRRTIGELDARRLLDDLVPGRRRRQLTDPLEPWIDALSACRLGLRDPDEIEAAYGGDVDGFADVLPRYRSELERRGQLDFDEQILTAIEVLLIDPEARRRARAAAPVLLVDEFQDLTPAHLLLVRLVAGPAGEVFAVGDDDQTIYGYSGASPDWLVSFGRYFPGATDHPLTVNYRCPPPVVEAAANLLSHNRHRVPKTIRSGRATEDDDATEHDGATEPLVVTTEGDPQRALVERVTGLVKQGVDPSSIAVLARVNAALWPAATYLADAGIPVARPLGVDVHLLERSGVGAALSWLRLATSPEQRLGGGDLRLALRRPPRSVHPRIVDWICEQRSVKDLLALAERLNSERDSTKVAELAADIERLRRRADGGASTVDLLDMILDDIGLLGAASQLDSSQRSARRAAHSDELHALRALAAIGPAPDELEGWLRDHLEAMPRADDPDRGDVVTLATVHSTKGLEWPHVIVHDVRGDLHPHRLAVDIEEERRIFHVAITRCRESVLINAHPPTAPVPRSPFLAELAQARPDDAPWPETPAPRRAPGPTTGAGGGAKSAKADRAEPTGPEAAARREALTAWRSERSRADGVPAYIVLDNATLDAIAESAPGSLVALGRIKGIGPTKLDRYGDDILGVVAASSP